MKFTPINIQYIYILKKKKVKFKKSSSNISIKSSVSKAFKTPKSISLKNIIAN